MQLFRKLKGVKTLLIDDNEEIRQTMDLVFRGNGCYIVTAKTGEEGLLAMQREKFDIIICDFRLPGINGVEFFEQAAASCPDTVKVLITGYGNQKTTTSAFEVGVHEFIKKPFALVTFLERLIPHVDRYLAEKRNHPASTKKKTAYEGQRNDLAPEVKENLSIAKITLGVTIRDRAAV